MRLGCEWGVVPVSLAMATSKYSAGGGGARGDMRGFNFGPPAGTTTYGGAGAGGSRYGGMGGGFMRGGMMIPSSIGPGGTFQGDPGLFSFLGKAARGITGVVSRLGIPIVSGAAGVASSLLGGGMRSGPGFQQIPFQPIPMQTAGQIPAPGVAGFMQRAIPGGATGMQGCGNGTRPNKSGYYVQGGQYVAPGTVCVKRRRMNPLNPRALSKAMRRIESAKRATTVLNRITIRKKC